MSGLAILATKHALTVSDNRALRCGYRAGASALPASGITVLSADGTVVIESCHVVDTGEPVAGAAAFQGPRWGLSVKYGAHARVHGCVITSRAIAGEPKTISASWALRVVANAPSNSEEQVDADASPIRSRRCRKRCGHAA